MNKSICTLYYTFFDNYWHKNISYMDCQNIIVYFYNIVDNEIVIPEVRLIAGRWE